MTATAASNTAMTRRVVVGASLALTRVPTTPPMTAPMMTALVAARSTRP